MVVAIVLVLLGLAILGTALAWALGWAPAARGTRIRRVVSRGRPADRQDAAAEFWEWLRRGG